MRQVVGKREDVSGVVGRRGMLSGDGNGDRETGSMGGASRTEEQDVGGVATGGFEAGFEGIGGGVIGGEEDDVAGLGGGAVWKRGAAGDAGGEGEGEEGWVTGGIGIEQGEVTKRDATGPEPGKRFGGDVG